MNCFSGEPDRALSQLNHFFFPVFSDKGKICARDFKNLPIRMFQPAGFFEFILKCYLQKLVNFYLQGQSDGWIGISVFRRIDHADMHFDAVVTDSAVGDGEALAVLQKNLDVIARQRKYFQPARILFGVHAPSLY